MLGNMFLWLVANFKQWPFTEWNRLVGMINEHVCTYHKNSLNICKTSMHKYSYLGTGPTKFWQHLNPFPTKGVDSAHQVSKVTSTPDYLVLTDLFLFDNQQWRTPVVCSVIIITSRKKNRYYLCGANSGNKAYVFQWACY